LSSSHFVSSVELSASAVHDVTSVPLLSDGIWLCAMQIPAGVGSLLDIPARPHRDIPSAWSLKSANSDAGRRPCGRRPRSTAYRLRIQEKNASVPTRCATNRCHIVRRTTRASHFPPTHCCSNLTRCRFIERAGGAVVNPETNRAFSLSDPCFSRGTTAGYSRAAHAEALQAVKTFLITTFKLSP
jgi:hypothetical protein